MTVISLAIHDEADPNGTALATITDDDVESFEFRRAENELGAGKLTIRRDHSAVQYLVGGNYIKVTIPVIDADPIFGFFINEADDTILASNEEGGETLDRGGPGSLAMLGRALLLDQFYNGPLGGLHRGNADIPGFWTWTAEPYGAILVRMIEEGQYEPGTPLQDVTIDFTRTHDTNADTWPDIIETIQVDIGTDGLGLYERLVATGNLFVVADPDLSIHGYGTPPGLDRTSGSFASGKVRFEKGVNIETELVRQDEGRAGTHALVKGKDLVYRQVVSPAYSSGPANWVSIDFPESNDTGVLDAVGARELARQQLISDSLQFAISPGDDEAAGYYLPFKHFQIGDLARLHTGSGASDFNELDVRVIGVRVVLGAASDDATDLLAARSLQFVLEVNGGPTWGGLGRRTPGVSVPNGCAPCPGDFPFVPNGQDHYWPVDFVLYGDQIVAVGHSADSRAFIAAGGVTYEFDLTIEVDSNGYAPGVILGTDPNVASGGNIVNGTLQGSSTTVNYTGTFTDSLLTTDDYWLIGTLADGPHTGVARGRVTGWIDPVGWVPVAATPPSAKQWVLHQTLTPAADSVEDTFYVPTGSYWPGSLILFVGGARQVLGTDYTESDPTTGEVVFLAGHIPASTPIADYQGTGH